MNLKNVFLLPLSEVYEDLKIYGSGISVLEIRVKEIGAQFIRQWTWQWYCCGRLDTLREYSTMICGINIGDGYANNASLPSVTLKWHFCLFIVTWLLLCAM